MKNEQFSIGYVVEKKCGSGGQWVRAHPVDVRDTEVGLTGLQPGREYQFRVKAANAVGWSVPSRESLPFVVPFDPQSAVKPSFISGLRDVTVMEHERVEFNVQVTGVPMPSVQWFINQSSILSPTRMVSASSTEDEEGPGVASLTISDVSAADAGEIKCLALNEVGQTSTSAVLQVEAPPRVVLTKKYEEGLIFEEGDAIRLRVEFTGRPRPTVTWYHENNVIVPDGGRMEVETEGTDCTVLKVAQAKRSDRGEYSVKLQSGLGEDSASFLVTIASKRRTDFCFHSRFLKLFIL